MRTGLTFIKNKISRFARDNWFKLFLVAIALYVFFQKDLSFQVQLRSPLHPGREEELPGQVEQSGKREKMTQRSGKVAESLPGQRNLFNLSSSFHLPWKQHALKERLKSVSEEEKIAYLKRFARVAMTEQQKFGIPASITLANALLHSAAGAAEWSVAGNNHFAITCAADWNGESGSYQGKCLRHFENAWASFRGHSLLLSQEWADEFPFGQEAGYQEWAAALAKNLYPQEKGAAQYIVALIEQYKLFELDHAGK